MPSPQELRAFIYEHFDLPELRELCFDHFPEVYKNQSNSTTKSDYILALMGWCQRSDQLDKLSSEVQIKRPKLFQEAFQDSHVGGLPNPCILTSPVRMEFVLVENIMPFWMGSDKSIDRSARYNELPRRQVTLDDYYIGKYPVTNEQYAVFAKAAGKGFRIPESKANHPVVNVSWHDADAFSKWLSAKTKRAFSLPTEAQWEKAARGVDGLIYPWGNEKPNNNLCNVWESGIRDTTPVDKYSPAGDSPYGCADMAGNVLEWCRDRFDKETYSRRRNETTHEPSVLANGAGRVLRGGAWYNIQVNARCATRLRVPPEYNSHYIGFRLVLDLVNSISQIDLQG